MACVHRSPPPFGPSERERSRHGHKKASETGGDRRTADLTADQARLRRSDRIPIGFRDDLFVPDRQRLRHGPRHVEGACGVHVPWCDAVRGARLAAGRGRGSRCSERGAGMAALPTRRAGHRSADRSSGSCSLGSSPSRTGLSRWTGWSTGCGATIRPKRPVTPCRATCRELRKAVGPLIEREGAGYRISVDRDTLDSLDFEAV